MSERAPQIEARKGRARPSVRLLLPAVVRGDQFGADLTEYVRRRIDLEVQFATSAPRALRCFVSFQLRHVVLGLR
jgi:hypothetical protein